MDQTDAVQKDHSKITDKQMYWIKFLAQKLSNQGILQQRANGSWRIRWREKVNDVSIHRSLSISSDDVTLVREIYDEIYKYRNQKRIDLRKANNDAAVLKKKYRNLRLKIISESEAGRPNRRKIARIFDQSVRMFGMNETILSVHVDFLKRSLRSPGRPRKSLPKY